jgi:HEAT repeat protein
MLARSVLALLFLWPTVLCGQVTGRFYLEKDTYAVGEPVFVYFETTNSGSKPMNVYRADPYSFCSGYSIQASSDLPKDSSCGPMATGGSCLSSDRTIEPGQHVTERILLNYEHKIDSAGQYDIEAEKSVSFAPADEEFFRTNKNDFKVHAHLSFRIDDNPEWDGAGLQEWVERLHSTDLTTRWEAARTLASMAPKSLEPTLLRFAYDKDLRYWAPLAFQRLNTPESLAAMARMLDTTDPGTHEHMEAAEFLAETGDPKWFPALLQVARKHSNIANYVYYAAELGGEQMLPTLFAMLQSSDTESTRPIGISALGYTGSRAAIPTLLGLLKSEEPETAQRALYALRQLTHRDNGGDHWFDNPQSQYSAWVKWWNTNGTSARVYKATDCGQTTPLR